MNWTKIHDSAKQIGFAIGFIALGAIGDGIINHTSKLIWLHQQAAAVPALKGQVAEKNKEIVEAHCERDLAMNSASIASGSDPQPVHCPEIKR